jgi:uncharacterized YigZ family protein
MKRIKESYVNLIEINKSKFYGLLIPIDNADEVKDQLVRIRKEYPKATHYCYAYRVNGLEKSNDDGEPAGTAGIPILEIIKQFDLENVLIVVVRYFGGIKLGAGGLVRAYARSAKEVLLISKIHEIKTLPTYNLIFDYNYISSMENFIAKNQLKILEKEYELKVTYTLLLETPNILEKITDFMQGKIEINYIKDIEYIY